MRVAKLTYRVGDQWTSELDVCILSHKDLIGVKDFCVYNDLGLPSDHAPISVCIQPPVINRDLLLVTARRLGDHAALYTSYNNHLVKPVKFNRINVEHFLGELSRCDIPDCTDDDINADIIALTNCLYKCASKSSRQPNQVAVDAALSRWERLLHDSDDKRIWEAIDWQGEYKENKNDNGAPSDEEFKAFFEAVYNPQSHENFDINEFITNVTVPILDDAIQVNEVVAECNNMKPNKSCGPDGLSPGVLRLLPAQWILTISVLFNAVFSSGCYPPSWRLARMFTIFKKGDKKLPKNYRGINVVNCMAKLFDLVLSSRLNAWFVPYREQAGSQKGRGCIEHLVTLRLLMDLARKKKLKLFITFVDFTMAYDRVPRAVGII